MPASGADGDEDAARDPFRASVRRFVEREIAPHAWDEAGSFRAVAAMIARYDAGPLDAGSVAELCLLKNDATQTMHFCADQAVQILGGMGFMRGTKSERIYRGQRDDDRRRQRGDHEGAGGAPARPMSRRTVLNANTAARSAKVAF